MSHETSFRELVEAMKHCCEKILAGDDPGFIWTTTLHSHAFVLSEDFTIFGTPRPSVSLTPKEPQEGDL